MKPALVIGLFALLFAARSFAEPVIQPGSDEWKSLYDPPYEKPTEVPVSSSLRKQLFDLWRAKVGKKYRFEGSLRVYRNWALFTGKMVDPQGKPVVLQGDENSDAAALLLRTAYGWQLVEAHNGLYDAVQVTWPKKYGVPKVLVGGE